MRLAVQSLMREWLVTRSEAPELWEPLGEALFKLTDWKDLVMVWRERVRELTQLVIDHIYIPERDPLELPTASAKKCVACHEIGQSRDSSRLSWTNRCAVGTTARA